LLYVTIHIGGGRLTIDKGYINNDLAPSMFVQL